MRRPIIILVIFGLVLWLGIPLLRAVDLAESHGGDSITTPAGLPVRAIHFSATDGVQLKGWLVPGRPGGHAIVVLVAGFQSDRMSMIPYARFLHAGGHSVLLYDSRGTGESGGHFTLGVREVDDVLGAVAAAARLHYRCIGLLGVSLGAGDVIVAAARDHRVDATVADSAYTDQDAVVNGLNHLHLIGPLDIPLAPDAGFVLDHLANIKVSSFRPIDAIGRIAPRPILLIHSRHDGNPTTPLAGAERLYRAAHQPASLWIAPRGGHAEALAAQPGTYTQRVLAFFRHYLAA